MQRPKTPFPGHPTATNLKHTRTTIATIRRPSEHRRSNQFGPHLALLRPMGSKEGREEYGFLSFQRGREGRERETEGREEDGLLGSLQRRGEGRETGGREEDGFLGNFQSGEGERDGGILTVIVFLGLHCLCVFAPFHFNWGALWVAIALYFVTLFGVTLSYHRNLAHKSFRLPKWLEYSFAYCGLLSLQGNPIDSVSTYWYHHKFTDTEKDAHSPIKGFWYSYMGWFLGSHHRFGQYGGLKNVEDLTKQPFYRFLYRTSNLHSVVLEGLLYAVGGFPFLVWGVGVRMVLVLHVTFLVNSVCHMWGKQAWNTGDMSRNNWLVALFALGEGWHNNHHAFEYSARQGLDWWQIDFTWYIIKFLEAIGLATDVKVPSQIQKQRKAFK